MRSRDFLLMMRNTKFCLLGLTDTDASTVRPKCFLSQLGSVLPRLTLARWPPDWFLGFRYLSF